MVVAAALGGWAPPLGTSPWYVPLMSMLTWLNDPSVAMATEPTTSTKVAMQPP